MLMVSVLLLAKYKDPCRWCGITGEAVEVDRQFLFGLYFFNIVQLPRHRRENYGASPTSRKDISLIQILHFLSVMNYDDLGTNGDIIRAGALQQITA